MRAYVGRIGAALTLRYAFQELVQYLNMAGNLFSRALLASFMPYPFCYQLIPAVRFAILRLLLSAHRFDSHQR